MRGVEREEKLRGEVGLGREGEKFEEEKEKIA